MPIDVASVSSLELSNSHLLEICTRICQWECEAYGEGKHRLPVKLMECIQHNDSTFFLAMQKGELIGYADLWQLKSQFYKLLLTGDLLEEQISYFQILGKQDQPSRCWYVGSIITAPRLRTTNQVRSAYVFKGLFNAIYDVLLASPYPARVMGVGSSEFGQKLLTHHGFESVMPSATAMDLRPRFEKRLEALELALNEDF